jgi:hypothetical protein
MSIHMLLLVPMLLISLLLFLGLKKKVLPSFQTANGRRKACNMLCGKGLV